MFIISLKSGKHRQKEFHLKEDYKEYWNQRATGFDTLRKHSNSGDQADCSQSWQLCPLGMDSSVMWAPYQLSLHLIFFQPSCIFLCLVAQSRPALCDPVDYSPWGSSSHGVLQARILEWVAISFSRGSSQPRDQNPGLLHCRLILYQLSYHFSFISHRNIVQIEKMSLSASAFLKRYKQIQK